MPNPITEADLIQARDAAINCVWGAFDARMKLPLEWAKRRVCGSSFDDEYEQTVSAAFFWHWSG